MDQSIDDELGHFGIGDVGDGAERSDQKGGAEHMSKNEIGYE